MIKRLPWFEIVLIVVFMSANLFAAFSDAYNLPNRWFIRDDAYYYFKVAQNISEGHGSTFDGIHPTNGYHPLWMLICIPIFALARFNLILPLRVLVIVTGLFQITTAILLYRLIRLAVSPLAGMLAGTYWAFNSYFLVFLYKTGVESIIALFLILLLLLRLCQLEKNRHQKDLELSQIAWLAVLATMVTFARLDLIFFALVLGIWIVFRQSPLRFLLPVDLLVIFVSPIIAFIFRLGMPAYYDAANLALIMALTAIIIKVPIFFLFGLYEPPSNWKILGLLRRLLFSVISSSAVLSILLMVATFLHFLAAIPRAILVIDASLTFGLLLVHRVGTFALRTEAGQRQVTGSVETLKIHWRSWFKEGSLYYGVLGGVLSIYVIWNRLVFGTFSPVSGDVKRWWGSFPINVYGGSAKSLLSFLFLNPYGDFNAWQPFSTMLSDWSNGFLYKEDTRFGNPSWQQNFFLVVAVILVAAYLVLLIRKKKSRQTIILGGLIPLFVGSWFQIFAYNVTGYASPKEWYWLTEPVLLIIAIVLLFHIILESLLKKWLVTRYLLWTMLAIFGVQSVLSYWQDAYALNPYGQTPASVAYADVVPFLEQYTPPGAIIGMTGGGNIGYFIHDRTIVNMDGLINSYAYFTALKNGRGAIYLYNSGMRYVFANPSLLGSPPYKGQYAHRLEPLHSWGGKDLMRLLPEPAN